MWEGNITTMITSALSWIVIILFIINIYRKQVEKAKLWKMIIVFWIGLFTLSFTLSFPFFNVPSEVAILPLGVWILYAILKRRNSWSKYRKYAWIGFFSNYIFLIGTLLAIPIHHGFYPKNDIQTYMHNLSEARVFVTHPSGNSQISLKQDAYQSLHLAKETPNLSFEWYYEIVHTDNEKKYEKFPYMLLDTQAKWGSGYQPIIYIERDGLGILISMEQKQLYFRLSESILNGVSAHE